MVAQLHNFWLEKTLRRPDIESQNYPQRSPRELTASTGVTSQAEFFEKFKETASAFIDTFIEAKGPRSENIGIFRVNVLPDKIVKAHIEAILERDGEGFIARTIELLLYGYGSDPMDAIQMLKDEIESLYDDLNEDDEFTADWLKAKNYLRSRISG